MKTHVLSIVLAAVAIVPAAAQQVELLHACYVPPTGVVYRTGAPGSPESCLDARHVAFSWTSQTTASGAGSRTVPSGAVMYFDLAGCPDGWTATQSAGRTIIGVPAGGTLAGEVGSALADLEDRGHAHDVTLAATTNASGSHEHILAGVEQAALPRSIGGHVWARAVVDHSSGWAGLDDVTWFSYNSAGAVLKLQEWQNGINSTEGDGLYHVGRNFTSSSLSSQHFYTDDAPAHAHDVAVPDRSLAAAGEHSHELSAESASAPAGTSDALPYVQLLACRKL